MLLVIRYLNLFSNIRKRKMVEAYWNIGKSIVKQKDGYKKQNMAADYFQIVT